MTVSDEAVEAAARIYNHVSTGADDWDDHGRWTPEDREIRLGEMRAALTAAAPFIAAQAWDAAVASLEYPDGSKVEVAANHNPYRSGT